MLISAPHLICGKGRILERTIIGHCYDDFALLGKDNFSMRIAQLNFSNRFICPERIYVHFKTLILMGKIVKPLGCLARNIQLYYKQNNADAQA